MTHKCRECNTTLVLGDNWNTCRKKNGQYICKECENLRRQIWRKANPEKERNYYTTSNRKRGMKPFDENRGCASFLGIHVAERVLRHVFKDVQVMPIHNPGYDIVCNHGKKIDIKAACVSYGQRSLGMWQFAIRKNQIADYFLCLAFDDRNSLNPMHIWLIPGADINHFAGVNISISTVDRWRKYEINKIESVRSCCDLLRRGE